jgi:hypothetical protein
MHHPVPGFLLPYILSGTLATLAALLFGLNRALKIANWPDRDRTRTVWSGAALLAAFYIAALLPSRLGLYHGTQVPTIQYGILIPIVAGIILFLKWRTLKRVVEAVPQQWLVGVQVYRTLGVIFLVLYAGARLPGLFALPAGVGDVSVGLLALWIGITHTRKGPHSTTLLRRWNLFGIADLTVAVTMGFLTSPSPLQIFALDAPNELITQFPLVMIPVFAVPLSILLHLASLQKLRQTESIQKLQPTTLANEPG